MKLRPFCSLYMLSFDFLISISASEEEFLRVDTLAVCCCLKVDLVEGRAG